MSLAEIDQGGSKLLRFESGGKPLADLADSRIRRENHGMGWQEDVAHEWVDDRFLVFEDENGLCLIDADEKRLLLNQFFAALEKRPGSSPGWAAVRYRPTSRRQEALHEGFCDTLWFIDPKTLADRAGKVLDPQSFAHVESRNLPGIALTSPRWTDDGSGFIIAVYAKGAVQALLFDFPSRMLVKSLLLEGAAVTADEAASIRIREDVGGRVNPLIERSDLLGYSSDREGVVSLFADQLEAADLEDRLLPGGKKIKPVHIRGHRFVGHTKNADRKLQQIVLWVDNARLDPSDGRALFKDLSTSLDRALGTGHLVENVPNFEDGSNPERHVRMWTVGEEVVTLTIIAYSKRASVQIERARRSDWLGAIGADSGEFWTTEANSPRSLTSRAPRDFVRKWQNFLGENEKALRDEHFLRGELKIRSAELARVGRHTETVTLRIGETTARHPAALFAHQVSNAVSGKPIFMMPSPTLEGFDESHGRFSTCRVIYENDGTSWVALETGRSDEFRGRVKIHAASPIGQPVIFDTKDLEGGDEHNAAMIYFFDIDRDGVPELLLDRRLHSFLDGGEKFANRKQIYAFESERGVFADATGRFSKRLEGAFAAAKDESVPFLRAEMKTKGGAEPIGEPIFPEERDLGR